MPASVTSQATTVADDTAGMSSNDSGGKEKLDLDLKRDDNILDREMEVLQQAPTYSWSHKGPVLAMALVFNCEGPFFSIVWWNAVGATYWFASSLGPLKTTIKKELGINNAQYGVITSSGNLVNTVVPFLSGIAIDYYGPEWCSLVSSSFILLGAIISGVGATQTNYPALVSGEVIVGLGSVTIETAQLKIYTQFFQGSHLGLVYGLNNAVNRVIVVVAKATAIPIVNGTGWWGWVIWMPAFISFFVLCINIIYVTFSFRLPAAFRPLTGRQIALLQGHGGLKLEFNKSWKVVMGLPAVFWLLVLTQLLQNATVQSYVSLQADMITQTRGAGLLSAGYISAVAQVPVIILAPLTGYFMDRFGHRMAFVPVSAAFFVLLFALTGFTNANAVALAIVQGIGLAINLLPFTISLPLLVPSLAYIGTAQGTYQAFINSGHVIVVTTAGAIQDLTPTGKDTYSNVLYYFIAIKIVDFLLGFFYIMLDRVALNSVLTNSEGKARALKKVVNTFNEKENQKRRSWLMDPSARWTYAGLGTGVAMTIVAWAVYLVYAAGN